jgi:hypothetical protein
MEVTDFNLNYTNMPTITSVKLFGYKILNKLSVFDGDYIDSTSGKYISDYGVLAESDFEENPFYLFLNYSGSQTIDKRYGIYIEEFYKGTTIGDYALDENGAVSSSSISLEEMGFIKTSASTLFDVLMTKIE